MQFAVDAALIYLALRGLASVLEHRRGKRQALAAEQAVSEEHDPAAGFEEFEAGGSEAAIWPRKGGGNGRDPDHH